VNFLVVQKLIKEHSSISEQETPRYILHAISNKMMKLKVAELLKNFPLSWGRNFQWHRRRRRRRRRRERERERGDFHILFGITCIHVSKFASKQAIFL